MPAFQGAMGRFIRYVQAAELEMPGARQALASKQAREAALAQRAASSERAEVVYGRVLQFKVGGRYATAEAAMARLPQDILAQLPATVVQRGQARAAIRLRMPLGRVMMNQRSVFIRLNFIKDTKSQVGFTRQMVDTIGNDMAKAMIKAVSVPIGKGAGGRVIRSAPFDYPRYDPHPGDAEATVGGKATLLKSGTMKDALSSGTSIGEQFGGSILKDSISHRITSTNSHWQLDVGTILGSARHFFWLERGTARMAPRPFASKTLAEFHGVEFDTGAANIAYRDRLSKFFGEED